jgi:type IV pilus assembly protein PilW
MKNIKGLTLIELMIALAISSIVAIGVMKAYVGQTVVIVKQARITQITEDGREAFSVISRLLKQAQQSSITITQPNVNNTTIDFTLPTGLAIWPNNTAPYINNAVRLSWTDQGANASKILLATADSIGNLAAAATLSLAGDSSVKNTQVSAFTLTDNNDGSYSLKLISQIANGAQAPLRVSFEGRILPRN